MRSANYHSLICAHCVYVITLVLFFSKQLKEGFMLTRDWRTCSSTVVERHGNRWWQEHEAAQSHCHRAGSRERGTLCASGFVLPPFYSTWNPIP